MYSKHYLKRIIGLSKTSAMFLVVIMLSFFGLTSISKAETIPAGNLDSTSSVQMTAPAITPPVQTSSNTDTNATPPTSDAPADSSQPVVGSSPAAASDSTNVTLTNSLDSSATSGDTTVANNSNVGTIGTGDSNASTTNINTLNSSIGLPNSAAPIIFNYDIIGNFNGDLLINPNQIPSSNTLPASGPTQTPISLDTLLNATLQNNINLSAVSGSSNVTNNLNTSDILTGDANAVANIINLLNSSISANGSFVGTINIFGNFEGNIVLPQDFVSNLIGVAQPTQTDNLNGMLNSVGDQNFSITNNINASATSGNVKAQNNSQIGDITSGDSSNNVVLMNLNNLQVTTKNMLLVFVNVLGTWLGLIFDAPSGSTTASLESNTPSDNAGQTIAPLNGSSLTLRTNLSIINNVNLAAQSGDANVAHNLHTGNIHTGNATTSANILNIISSRLNLSDWFGVLFINVFGKWHGNLTVAPETISQPQNVPPVTNTSNSEATKVFNVSKNKLFHRNTKFGMSNSNNPIASTAVASDNTLRAVSKALANPSVNSQSNNNLISFWVVLSLITISGAFGTRYFISPRVQI